MTRPVRGYVNARDAWPVQLEIHYRLLLISTLVRMWSIYPDLKVSIRSLLRDRGSLALALAALALGIGATTCIFSVIENVLIHPFPYAGADRLINVVIGDSAHPGASRWNVTAGEFLDYQNKNTVFDQVLAASRTDALYDNGDGVEQWSASQVSSNTFPALGVAPLLGRGLMPGDEKAGAAPVFVMSYKLWNRDFGRDATVIGRQFVLSGTPRICVGVMPPRFTWWNVELWLPASLDPEGDRADKNAGIPRFSLIGRLKPGVTEAAARANLLAIARQEALTVPALYPKTFTVETQTMLESVVQHFRAVLFVLLAAVAMLLLIACANVANLLLARAGGRAREMAIRASLGAARGRLFRLALTESALLALLGALLGCVLAYAGLEGLSALIPRDLIPDEAVIRLDLPALWFSLALACFTTLLCGAIPALQASQPHLNDSLKNGSRGSSARGGLLRHAFVVTEIALSLVLLTGAGLLIRSFSALQQVDLGLNPEKLLFARLPLSADRYRSAADVRGFYQSLLARLEALPGVLSAAESSSMPLYPGISSPIEIAGQPHAENWTSQVQLVSAGYPKTVGLRLLRGRALSQEDVNDARRVAIVNSQLVRAFFGPRDPIGKHIRVNVLEILPGGPVPDANFEIVGVYAGSKNHGLQRPAEPEMLVPYTITPVGARGILVRTTGDPLVALSAVRREVRAIDPNLAIAFPGDLKSYLKRFSLAQPRFGMVLMGIFAVVGLVLVAIGIYGVMAFSVVARTQEIGIRMAVGAQTRQVLSNVLARGVRLIAAGVFLGLAASFAITRIFASQLFGVSPTDPLSLAGALAVVIVAGLAACYFPARKAAGVDPLIALRHE